MWSSIISIIKAIPTVKQWVDQLVALYVSHTISEMKSADKEAIRKAIYEQDQRDLEKQLNSDRAGKPSDNPNTEFRDSLPNVVRDKR